jgi:hypothetical protein
MANLTSSLTLKLTDLLSRPAGEAAAALKKFGLSAQDLQKSAKLDVFRQLQQSFAAARTTFRDAQQNVRALAQQIAATDSPTKQLTRSFAQAQREVTSASRAFEQQSAAIIAAKTSLTGLGVPLNQIVTEETRLKTAAQAATVAMEQQAQRAQSIGARIRRGMGTAFGNIAPFLGPPILGATYKAVKAGAAIDSAQMGLRVAGIPDTEIARVTKMALKQQALYPQLAINEILDRYKEARSVTPKAADAERMLPVLAQAAAALKALESDGKAEAGSIKGLGFALKAAQTLGAAQNPERLRTYLEAFIKAKQVKGDLITPDQIYAFMAGLKGSGALLSDRFLHTTAMSLAAELKGGRAGSGIDAFVKAIVAPVGATAKEFLELGLMSKSDFKPPQQRGGFGKSFGRSPGKLGEVKLGAHVAGWELAQTDPDKWVAQYLLPALKQKGITDLPAILALVEKIFPGRASDIVTKLITQAESYKDEAQKMRAALGLAATDLYKDDAAFQLQTMGQALANFGGVLTSPIMTAAAHAMNFIARTFAEWAASLHDWNEKNPGVAKVVGGTAITAGAVGGAALTYGVVRGLWTGFGLKSSAAALDVAAVNLSAAALKLGAGGVLAGGARAVGAEAPLAAAAGQAIATGIVKSLVTGVVAGVVAYEIEAALYEALVPEATKKEIKRRSDAIDAMKPEPGTTKAEVLRQSFNSDRARLGIPLIGSDAADEVGKRELLGTNYKPTSAFADLDRLKELRRQQADLDAMMLTAKEKGGVFQNTRLRSLGATKARAEAEAKRIEDRLSGMGVRPPAQPRPAEISAARIPPAPTTVPATGFRVPLPQPSPAEISAARIPPAPTTVPATGFRLDAGPDRAIKASPGDFSKPPAPTEGYRIPPPQPRPAEIGAAPISPPPIESRELDAKAAGQAFGKAFREGAVEEVQAALSEVGVLVNKIIGVMTFSASPDVTPQAAGAGTPGAGGQNVHGIFSDYGIRP